MPSFNLLTIFITGLTTGGLTCLALQGGLLASVIASSKLKIENSKIENFIPITYFLAGKLLIHTLLGFLLGALGQTLTLSPITRGWFQIIIGIYLLGIAGNLLNLHPLFRYAVLKPPKFLARIAKKSSSIPATRSLGVVWAPFILGLTTIFIPCAVTQATEVIAIGSGNPLSGAAIMFAFILGTMPTFILFGFLLNSGAGVFQKHFPKIAATALILMSLFSINNGVGLTGSVYTFQNFYRVATEGNVLSATTASPVITVTNQGYFPTSITLKKDVPVRLTLKTVNVQSCSRSFTIPSLNIEKLLLETGETIIEFTPTTLGSLVFTCSMGMYTGRFNIIN